MTRSCCVVNRSRRTRNCNCVNLTSDSDVGHRDFQQLIALWCKVVGVGDERQTDSVCSIWSETIDHNTTSGCINSSGVDGGAEYFGRIGDTSDCEDLSITDKTPTSEIRNKFHWGSYGVNGDEPLQMRRLSELSNSHIQAILENVFKNKKSTFKSWFEMELSYRKENDIEIEY